jgi:hypothetical protein
MGQPAGSQGASPGAPKILRLHHADAFSDWSQYQLVISGQAPAVRKSMIHCWARATARGVTSALSGALCGLQT